MEDNDYCSYELSIALKAAGFDEPCDHYWCKKFSNSDEMALRQASADDYNNDDWDVPHCSAPHIYQAQKWLRENHDWHIVVEPRVWEQQVYDYKLWSFMRGYENANRGFDYLSYESALSAGIEAALKLLDNEKE